MDTAVCGTSGYIGLKEVTSALIDGPRPRTPRPAGVTAVRAGAVDRRSSRCRIGVALCLLAGLAGRPVSATAQDLTATITCPADGTTNADPSQPIQWTTVGNAQAYVVWIGTTPGAADVLGTNELSQTSYQPANLPANQTLYARMWTEVGGSWRYVDSTFTAETLAAILTSPVAGATSVSPWEVAQWTAIPNAQAYVLWIGTAQGAGDIVGTSELQGTSYQPATLPANRTLYARMWTEVGGTWRFADSTFITAPLSTLVTPAAGAVNVNVTQPLQWTSVPAAQAYVLWVGTAVGGHDVVATYEVQGTSYQASLPPSRTLYARVWTEVGGIWRYVDSTFTTAPVATLVAPANGATGVSATPVVQWTPVAGAQAYVLWVGTTVGANNVIETKELQVTAYQPSTLLPANRMLYARMWTELGGVWRAVDSTFSTAPMATLTSPADGTSGFAVTSPMQWTSVSGAQAYELWVGTTIGGRDVFATIELQVTSYQPTGLPPNQTLYARMWTEVGGIWQYVDSLFTAASITARLTTPANGATNVSPLQAIQWTTVPSVQAYVLWVGTTVGANNVVNTPEIQSTSFQPVSLPANQTLYARMWAQVGGVWRSVDSTFATASPTATMIYPIDGATDVALGQSFSWTSVPNAQAYQLWVGSAVDLSDVANSYEIAQTSYAVDALPAGASVLYITIWTKVSGAWCAAHTSFQPRATSVATFRNPIGGQTNVDLSQPVQWTSVGADAYQLFLGSGPGLSDDLQTPELHQTSFLADQMAAGGTIYARLRTRIGATWWYQDISFTVLPFAPSFVYPASGAIGVDVSRAFEWTPGQSADGYYLWIGTSPGTSDLVLSGVIAGTSYVVSNLPADRTLYGRIWSRVAGNWTRYSDVAFTLQATVSPAAIVFPPDGSSGADGGQPFEWSATDLAEAYRLTIGSSLGASDLHDSGEIRVTRRFVDNLPIGGQLFGRVSTKIAGLWYSADFTFSLATNVATSATRISAAMWATNLVRGMTSSLSNRPYRWTPLWDAIDGVTAIDGITYGASCGTYAQVLLSVLSEMNLGLQVRGVTIRFSQGDTHALAEALNPATNEWLILDPTFDLVAKRAADGGWASAADIAQATVAQDWLAIQYVFLGPDNDAYVQGYFLDYPLLYLNDFVVASPWHDATPYLTPVSLPAPSDVYILACVGDTQAETLLDGAPVTIACGSDGLSGAFVAGVDQPTAAGGTFHLWRPRRFVF